jgi:hypothetical protein
MARRTPSTWLAFRSFEATSVLVRRLNSTVPSHLPRPSSNTWRHAAAHQHVRQTPLDTCHNSCTSILASAHDHEDADHLEGYVGWTCTRIQEVSLPYTTEHLLKTTLATIAPSSPPTRIFRPNLRGVLAGSVRRRYCHCVGELAANNVASPCAAEEVDRVRRWHVLTSS